MRLLAPGGSAVFQVPNGSAFNSGSWRAMAYTIRRQHLRRLWKVLRNKPPYEIHYVPRCRVEQIIADAGATLLAVEDVGQHRQRGENFRYSVTK
jgi:hypothetical protein